MGRLLDKDIILLGAGSGRGGCPRIYKGNKKPRHGGAGMRSSRITFSPRLSYLLFSPTSPFCYPCRRLLQPFGAAAH